MTTTRTQLANIKGTKPVRLNARDWSVLGFIGQLGMIRTDDVGFLLGRGVPLAPRTVRAVIARWERAGFVERHHVTAGPSSITLTAHARYRLQLPTSFRVGLPAWSQIPHTLTTAAIATRYQTGFVEDGTWSHPSMFGTRHQADGIVETPEAFIAVEVELNRKSSDRWADILGELAGEWDRIHYWVAAGIEEPLRRVLEESLPVEQQAKFRFFPVGELQR